LRENLIRFADVGVKTDVDNVKHLLEWFTGTSERLKNIELGLNNKWSIVYKLYQYKKLDHHKKEEIFKIVADIDPSDTMKTMKKRCESIIANPEEMHKLWATFFDDKITESNKIIGASMIGFNNSIHENEVVKYHSLFFEKILEVFKTRSREFAKEFYYNLFPNQDSLKEYLEKVKELIAKTPQNEDWLLRILRESHDDFERRIKCTECLMHFLEKH